MSSYFDQLEQAITDAANNSVHMPWYVRIRRVSRARGLVVVLVALVVAAPAVGATTNWFGFGTTEYFPKTTGIGHVLPGTSQLLPIRVADPQGGPSWGIRIVRTTQADGCIQLGRVEDGQLGSLGIDYSWDNDNQFHRFPNTSIGENCGTTDAVGHAFVNVTDIGAVASANPIVSRAPAIQARSCQLVPMDNTRLQRPPPPTKRYSSRQLCPTRSERIVFMGLLGPDARAITYKTPGGSLSTIKTTGGDGAYLLVFPLDQATCNLYTDVLGTCDGGVVSGTSPSPGGAITAVTYNSGRVCNLDPRPTLATQYLLMTIHQTQIAGRDMKGGRLHRLHVIATVAKERHAELDRFARAHHLTAAQLLAIVHPQCPTVGYVAPKDKRLTAAELATQITVSRIRFWTRPAFHLPGSTSGLVKIARVVISFAAPQPVTNSDSWYEATITSPAGCRRGTSFDGIGPPGDLRSGQELHLEVDEAACEGVYHGVIGYMQNGGPQGDGQPPDPGEPGHDGSYVVGRFTFTIH